jgi:ligand-binding sensor domain-containing protein
MPKHLLSIFAVCLVLCGASCTVDDYAVGQGLDVRRIAAASLDIEGIRFIRAHDRFLLILTSQKTIVRFDTESEEVKYLNQVNGNISEFNLGPNGEVLVGTYNQGMWGFDLEGNELFHLTTANSCLPTNAIQTVAMNTQGQLYFGANRPTEFPGEELERYGGYGLMKTDVMGLNCEMMADTTSGLVGNLVRKVHIDANDEIWVAVGNYYSFIRYANPIVAPFAIHYLDATLVIDTVSWTNIQHIGTVSQMSVNHNGRLWFTLYHGNNDYNSVQTPAYEYRPDGAIRYIGPNFGQRPVRQVIGELSTGSRVSYGYYNEPIEYKVWEKVYFFGIEEEGVFVDYIDEVGEKVNFNSIAIDRTDHIWLATDSELIKITQL